MGLIVLSIMLSIILGACVWLLIGNRFPVSSDEKWPVTNNIVCYALIVLLPIYLVIFFSF